jgi:hypothetical protein
MTTRLALLAALVGASTACTLYTAGSDDPVVDDPPPSEPPSESLVTLLATDEPGVYEMAGSATHLYWVDNGQFDGEANLRRMPRAGGAIETLLSIGERVYALDVAAGFAYVTHTGASHAGEILRVPVTGGAPVTLATGLNPSSITVDGGWVYYSKAYSPAGQIWRVATNGGAPELVVDDVDNPWDLVARNGVLFYSEMNRGRIMRVVPGSDPMILAAGWVGTRWLTADDSFAYFSACSTGPCEVETLYRVPLGGGALDTLFSRPGSEAKIGVAGARLQWGWHATTTAGQNPIAMSDDGYPIAVATTTETLYFADFFTGRIFASTE